MSDLNYTPNSHKYKKELTEGSTGEGKKVEKVVKGTVRTKKKNEIGKLADIFISEDVSNVKSYILMDVLVPAIKKAISDIVTDGIDMVLYGGSGKVKRKSNSSYVSYRDYAERDARRHDEPRVRTRFDYDDIIFESRGEAERVREHMEDMIDRYGVVTVGDMYDMADLTAPYTANKYGWTNIRSAEAVRLRDGGYTLKLPKAMPID